MACLLRGNLLWRQLDAGEDKDRANQRSTDRAQRIESLREIQAPFRTILITQLSDERIGCRFQERPTAGNHEQSEEKKAVAAGNRGRPEQKSARTEKKQSDHETWFVSHAPHEESGGHGQQKISHVKRRLDQASLEARNCE